MPTREFINSELEERMLSGRDWRETIAAGHFGHSGSTSNPANNTEIMLQSIEDASDENSELQGVFSALERLEAQG